ncbi:stonustoxin subunit alpha-like [Colossoma macropomum]|uniref:stonustoxin subunit alpha-like n=1 Tax=Colossoma macropomum TaxID=42526 RepID=UPI0018641562|nr:stonustoxin subunit alpha-like [Colossoma macropomum]
MTAGKEDESRPKKPRHHSKKLHDRKRNKTRVNLGDAFKTWRILKDQRNFKTDADFADFLLERRTCRAVAVEATKEDGSQPKKLHDLKRDKTRVNLGKAFETWRLLRDQKNFKTDADFAHFLLRSVCLCTDAVELTLDSNTVFSFLSLSDDKKNAQWEEEGLCYPPHDDRFGFDSQVLSVESLTGRCYWEVQWSGEWAGISVSYKGRNVYDMFGSNNQSWILICDNNNYSVWHNKEKTVLTAPPSPSNRVGVYLDRDRSTLSFYIISPDTCALTHLHTLTTTFTEPLYAGFYVYPYSSMHLCKIVR